MLAPVYDIVNCGPRHRFWANGKIVHNSGGLNFQNLTRGSRLRQAIEAPDGYMLAVADLSAIEARVLAWLAGQEDVLELYRNGGDIYCDMAGKIYGREITKADKRQRQVGKSAVLGSGYGMGWRRFQEYVTDTAKITFTQDDANITGVDVRVFLSNKHNVKFVKATCPSFIDPVAFAIHCAVAENIINIYRSSNDRVTALWDEMGSALLDIYNGRERQVGAIPGVVTTHPLGFAFPRGRYVRYAELTPHQKKNRLEWSRRTREGVGFISKGLATENCVQALARHIMADQMLRLHQEGYRVVLSCHDEIVLCEREERAEAALARMIEVMSTAPEWAPGLPLACEGAVGKNYGEAK